MAILLGAYGALKHLMIGIGRPVLRAVSGLALATRQGAQGRELRLGRGVTISGGRHIFCATGVTIGDDAEIIATRGPAPEGISVDLGRDVRISRRCQIAPLPGARIRIGDYSSLHNGTYLLGNVQIGRYCLLSANIFVSSGDHYAFREPYLLIREQDEKYTKEAEHGQAAVVIEDDCWIGWGVAIKKGVSIGKGAVVGANCIVTKDVEPYAVVAGQPARAIRSRVVFLPPTRIDAIVQTDWPYLYRGFMLSPAERGHRGMAGHVGALQEAVLVLARVDFQAMRLSGFVHVEDGVAITLSVDHTRAVSKRMPGGSFEWSIDVDALHPATPSLSDHPPRLPQHLIVTVRVEPSSPGGQPRTDMPSWSIQSFELMPWSKIEEKHGHIQ